MAVCRVVNCSMVHYLGQREGGAGQALLLDPLLHPAHGRDVVPGGGQDWVGELERGHQHLHSKSINMYSRKSGAPAALAGRTAVDPRI